MRVALAPTTRVTGAFSCSELGTKPDWAITYVYAVEVGPDARILQNITKDARIDFVLPVGKYSLNQYGTDIATKNRPLDLSKSGAEVDLGTLLPRGRRRC